MTTSMSGARPDGGRCRIRNGWLSTIPTGGVTMTTMQCGVRRLIGGITTPIGSASIIHTGGAISTSNATGTAIRGGITSNPNWVAQHHADWYGTYDQNHQWHDLYWWGARNPAYIQQTHPQCTFALQQAVVHQQIQRERSLQYATVMQRQQQQLIGSNRALAQAAAHEIAQQQQIQRQLVGVREQQQRAQQQALQQAQAKNLVNAQQLAQLNTQRQKAQQQASIQQERNLQSAQRASQQAQAAAQRAAQQRQQTMIKQRVVQQNAAQQQAAQERARQQAVHEPAQRRR